ncbi:MAG: small mechanosensitive ion channel protein MscS, partial [Pedosphaera sp.]|nr:small mechanosensitive ion channel protein MscS [Pedosphaera sp.]
MAGFSATYLDYRNPLTMQTSGKVLEEAVKPETWHRWGEQAWRVVLVLVVAWLLTRLVGWAMVRLRRYTIRVMDRRGEGDSLELEKRANTLISALNKAADMLIWVGTVVTALRELNYHVKPILAGLGVAGIAVGLGAQTIIKDWLGGFFLLIEDQIRIGDAVVINGMPTLSGVVESIGLRTTLLRGAGAGAQAFVAPPACPAFGPITRLAFAPDATGTRPTQRRAESSPRKPLRRAWRQERHGRQEGRLKLCTHGSGLLMGLARILGCGCASVFGPTHGSSVLRPPNRRPESSE